MTTPRITEYERHGHVFDVIDRGPLDGTAVVLLHGFPQRATAFDAVSARLVAAGCRTYRPDQRGYSPRARPDAVSAYRGSELADDVAALVAAVGGPVHLVGHDFGANVAWTTAYRHPTLVRSLTAMSVGHPKAFLRAMITSGQLLRSWYMLLLMSPLAERVVSRRGGFGESFLRKGGMTDEMYDCFQRDIVEGGALTPALNWYRAIPGSIREEMGPVRVPTTLVWSTDDRALGRAQAVKSEEFVDAPFSLQELPGGSHWIPQEAPDEAADAILARIRSAG